MSRVARFFSLGKITESRPSLGIGWRAAHLASLSVALLCALPGCGSELRRAQLGSHPVSGSEPDIVDFPPPPAEVEDVPPDPGPPCVWVDGRWEYVGRRWEWQAGAWVNPSAACFYAPPVMVWLPSDGAGELYYLQGRWYTEGGEPCGEPKACRIREDTLPGSTPAPSAAAGWSPGETN